VALYVVINENIKFKFKTVLQNLPNTACRRLGYAFPIHGWLAQNAERLTQTVGRLKPMGNGNLSYE
jgi:hypothetical protein